MSIVRCPKCNLCVNTVYYPGHYEKPRPDCPRCRWRETKDIEVLNEIIAGMARTKKEADAYLAKVKKHYDEATAFNPDIEEEDEYGYVRQRVT